MDFRPIIEVLAICQLIIWIYALHSYLSRIGTQICYISEYDPRTYVFKKDITNQYSHLIVEKSYDEVSLI